MFKITELIKRIQLASRNGRGAALRDRRGCCSDDRGRLVVTGMHGLQRHHRLAETHQAHGREPGSHRALSAATEAHFIPSLARSANPCGAPAKHGPGDREDTPAPVRTSGSLQGDRHQRNRISQSESGYRRESRQRGQTAGLDWGGRSLSRGGSGSRKALSESNRRVRAEANKELRELGIIHP